MNHIGVDSPDILYMGGDETSAEAIRGIIPRAEVRLKCVNAFTKENIGTNFTVHPLGALEEVLRYLRTLYRSAVAVINTLHNWQASSYTICGVEKEDSLSFTGVLTNAMQSAIASDAGRVTLVCYYPERTREQLITDEDMKGMAVYIQMFYIIGIPVDDIWFANDKNLVSAKDKYPECFKDVYVDEYLKEIGQKILEIREGGKNE